MWPRYDPVTGCVNMIMILRVPKKKGARNFLTRRTDSFWRRTVHHVFIVIVSEVEYYQNC